MSEPVIEKEKNANDVLFRTLLDEKFNGVVSDDFLVAYACELERQPLYDSFGWGITLMMIGDQEKKQTLFNKMEDARKKPLACAMCAHSVATNYHILIGQICDDCNKTLPTH
jgi:hypothetical protein